MAGSISVAVRKAIADGLTAHFAALPDFNGTTDPAREVEVTYGYGFGSSATERIYTGRTSAQTPPAGLRAGANFRNETTSFDLNVLVKFIGGDAYEADQRLDDICDELEDWISLRKSNQLGVGLTSLRLDGYQGDYLQIDGGAASVRTYSILYTARNTTP
jgi:hypothetical protein